MERRLAAASSLHPDRQPLSSVPRARRLDPAVPATFRHVHSARCRNLSPFSGNANLRSAGVQLPFPLVELRLPVVDGPVSQVSQAVPLVSDLIAPVSNEVALVSGPRALLVA